ncbi:hypothetical protein [Acaryochloris sp. CCMEE 5410]|uniref:hypothetical protein n=1 Tax=Acaryochloris sp. CCMEE 5410 TaxID=310037 RepID=UPI002934340C|nr:hypothetical protein [Acaryochloris sp. CCMEE 5410]
MLIALTVLFSHPYFIFASGCMAAIIIVAVLNLIDSHHCNACGNTIVQMRLHY